MEESMARLGLSLGGHIWPGADFASLIPFSFSKLYFCFQIFVHFSSAVMDNCTRNTYIDSEGFTFFTSFPCHLNVCLIIFAQRQAYLL